MSHVATIDLEIRDLEALEAACKRLGGELMRGQNQYAWYGEHIGDYPVPAGFTVEDLGRCEHAIKFPDVCYEVGVVRRRDGRPGWQLLWDFIDSDLVRAIGESGGLLKQAYGAVVAQRTALRQGFHVTEQKRQDGSIRMVLSR